MKDAISLAAETLAYKRADVNDAKFWESVSHLDGEALALVISECPDEAASSFGDSNNRPDWMRPRLDFDFGKLDAKGWIALLARWPEIAYSMSFECKDSVWESESRVSSDEIVPGVRWVYEVHAGRAYVNDAQGGGLAEEDKKAISAALKEQGLPLWLLKTKLDHLINVCGGTCTIPSHIDGTPVFAIEKRNNSITGAGACFTRLVVSEGIVEFYSFPFSNCAESVEVVFPSTLRYIAEYEFDCMYGMSFLVRMIRGVGGLSGLHGVSAFSVAEDNPCFKSIRGLLLTKDGKTLIHGVNGDVTIPDGVTRIGCGAFMGCEKVKSVRIPDSVTSIGNQAFDGCRCLTCVTIPDSVMSVGADVFSDCSGLKNVVLPKRFKKCEIFDNHYGSLNVTYRDK